MQPDTLRSPTPVTLDGHVAENVHGAIDRIYDRRVTGWAWDRRAPGDAVEVEILLDGSPIARARADRLREDLRHNGVGSGHHAFDIRVNQELPVDAKHRIAAIAVDGAGERRVTLLNREAPPPPGPLVAAEDGPRPVAVSAVPEALGRWLDDFRVVQASLENALIAAVKQVRSTSSSRTEMAHDSQRVGEAIDSLHSAQGIFTRQLETMEAVQARIDEALAAIRVAEAERPRRDAAERWLKRMVNVLAVLSATALGLGIYSLFV